MPIHEVRVREYECSHCGYRWINRVNGKDGYIPRKCAKCKRSNWNGGDATRITPEENGLRRIIKGFRVLYNHDVHHLGGSNVARKKILKWPVDLSEQFLNMDPRPTVEELMRVIHSSPLHRYNNGEATHRMRGRVPNPKHPTRMIRDPSTWEPVPDRPGYIRFKRNVYDDPNFVSDYGKWIIKEASIRQKLMIDIMKSRGITYEPDPVFVAAYKNAEADREKKMKEMLKPIVEELKANRDKEEGK